MKSKKKYKVYSYKDKVSYYTNTLLDKNNSINKKYKANNWLQKNLYDNFFVNSKRLNKNEIDRTNKAIDKFLDIEYKKIYKKKRK